MTIKVQVTNEGINTQTIKVIGISPHTHILTDINSNRQLKAGETAEFYVNQYQSLVISEVDIW